MTKLTERDKQMLKMLSEKETILVAYDLNLKPNTIYARLSWIRQQKAQAQTLLNQLLNYEKQSLRVKKLLTPNKKKELT